MPDELDKARQTINEVDAEMARLFEARMNASKTIAEYKAANGLQITDETREKAVIEESSAFVENADLRQYFADLMKNAIALSKRYQRSIIRGKQTGGGKIITVSLGDASYDITVGRGLIREVGSIFGIRGKCIVVTDDGVPEEYSKTVAENLGGAPIYTLPHGEKSKNIAEYGKLLAFMLDNSLTRSDAVVAVGGGVVGDLACFAASTYMRGIAFYNVPTTLLAQVDSSIGGKCGIDFGSYKNTVGTFCQPRGVIVDPDLTATLDRRNIASGYAEAVKMALTSDAGLFSIFEHGEQERRLDEVIIRSLNIKKAVVEKDERESGFRRLLNFGHTVGHAIESIENGRLTHGECVALGMIPMTSPKLRRRLINVLEMLGLPTEYDFTRDEIIEAMSHDKKADGGAINAVFVSGIGSFEMRRITESEMKELLTKVGDGQ